MSLALISHQLDRIVAYLAVPVSTHSSRLLNATLVQKATCAQLQLNCQPNVQLVRMQAQAQHPVLPAMTDTSVNLVPLELIHLILSVPQVFGVIMLTMVVALSKFK